MKTDERMLGHHHGRLEKAEEEVHFGHWFQPVQVPHVPKSWYTARATPGSTGAGVARLARS